MTLFEQILKARGLSGNKINDFINPKYEGSHNPFLLPDMQKATDRLVRAHKKNEKITIYGDYDIDGLTASTVLIDAFELFGFKNIEVYIPNRFVEGYGLTVDAVEKIASSGANLIVTVDCGSLSEKEIIRAKELNVDVIVTDHHNVAPTQPPAVAVINPKRLLQDHPDKYQHYVLDSTIKNKDLYPFLDLAGVGVAFKLVQALQTRLAGLPTGQEKWLLDLVALGTVCDVVTLVDENRTFVYWGLKVLAKTKRPGLKALMAVAGVEPSKINAKALGFGLGPRMNASGRLETAQHAFDMLHAKDNAIAYQKAQMLDEFNQTRRVEQSKIFEEACRVAEQYLADDVLVVSGKGWSHGIIGIVAAKLLEKYKKPTYVLEEMGDESKGSARSFGDFSASDAIRSADDIINKGGGHKLAAGVSLPTKNIDDFRQRVNEFYQQKGYKNQKDLLLPQSDVEADFSELTEDLINEIQALEPFGNGNPQPIIKISNATVITAKRMGADGQHVKLTLKDSTGISVQMLAFNAPENFFKEAGENVTAWYHPTLNEWNGNKTVEGYLLHIESI